MLLLRYIVNYILPNSAIYRVRHIANFAFTTIISTFFCIKKKQVFLHLLWELFLCLLRIKFWVLILFRNLLDKAVILSYNTTPAEEGTECCSLLRPHSLTMLFAPRWPHSFLCFLSCRPHVVVGMFSSLRSMLSFVASGVVFVWISHLQMMTTYHFLGHGFDHIFDHKQNRSTRRQDVTRVWKSRFCVAERAKKSKNG